MDMEPLSLHDVGNGSSARASDPDRNWKPLRYFNLYRATLSGLLIALTLWGSAPNTLGRFDAELFGVTATFYFAFSVASGFAIHLRWPSFVVQVVIQVCTDIVAISLMMYASGGVASGFGMLLVVVVAGGSLLTEGRIAILFAALASLAVLAQQFYARLGEAFPAEHTQAGMLGVTFFATALLAYVLARRVRASEALAVKRGIDLANLAQLNEHIIQRMQSGILALDSAKGVRLINESARTLLGLKSGVTGWHMQGVVPELAQLLERWRVDGGRTTYVFQSAGSQIEVIASFAGLGQDGSEGALVFLEDASAMRARAHKLKLASLGHLTASIAHEIRNPLGAISHAGQLLGESSQLSTSDRRLIQIVQENCRRMNNMVEDILRLSRRKASAPECFELKPWLEVFRHDFMHQASLGEDVFSLSVDPPTLRVRIDPGQLHQVLWNLCDNGARHAQAARHAGREPRLELHAGMRTETQRPYLDVIDNGLGVSQESSEHIFEPFYTTEPRGTGLGLYIARELCESNQASLSLVAADGAGCRFRITFSDPRRQGVSAL